MKSAITPRRVAGISSVSIGCDLFVIAVLCWRAFLVEGKHWGFDNTLLVWIWLAKSACLLALFAAERRANIHHVRLLPVSVGLSALTLLVAWTVVRWNLVLPYELWIERGMP